MPKKYFNRYNISPENKRKVETIIVKGTITINQKKVIQTLIGPIGSNEQDVIGKIITLWLYNEGYIKKNA